MPSPTERTLKQLKQWGYMPAVVERWNPWAKIRQDLFGFADIVAIHPEIEGVLAVQCTTDANLGERMKKVQDNATARIWRKSKNAIWIVGWAKRGARGKAKHWRMRGYAVAEWYGAIMLVSSITEDGKLDSKLVLSPARSPRRPSPDPTTSVSRPSSPDDPVSPGIPASRSRRFRTNAGPVSA